MHRIFFLPSAALAAALAAHPSAVAAKNSLTISASVRRSCDVVALPMTFGTVALNNPQADTQAHVIVDCTPSVPFVVTMNDGLHVKNGQRRMENPGANGVREYLEYEIYRNAARTQRWGGTAATGISQTAPASGRVVLTAYGHTNGKKAAASPYRDSVTVTIAF